MDINVKVTLEAPSLIEALVKLFPSAGNRTAPPAVTTAAPLVHLNYTPAPPPIQQPASIPVQGYAPAPVAPPVAYTPPVSVPAPMAPPPVPVAQAPAYNMDTLANAAAGLMQAGKQQELVALLGQYGVQALTQLKPEQYGTFATALRQMGGKI